MPASPTSLRLNSFIGGVATTPATKRMPTELEAADNVMITLEENSFKRPGFELIDPLSIQNINPDAKIVWIDRDSDEQYVVVINPEAPSNADIVSVFDAQTGEKLTNSPVSMTDTQAAYLRAGSGAAKDKLRVAQIFDATAILNTEVEAKFLNTGAGQDITYTYADIANFPDKPVVERITLEENVLGERKDDPIRSQNVENFSYVQFPPDTNDINPGNNGAESVVGSGKVYFCREPFLDTPSGFYRAVSTNTQPYYEKTRTESVGSVLDSSTLPLLLVSLARNNWVMDTPNWSPRFSGNNNNNPGPSPIANSASPYATDGTNTGARFSDIAFWRNRLWLSSGDTIISSQFNDLFNLFLEDATTVVDTDPVDVAARTGKVSSVESLTPFADFMFVQTKGKVQFELKGSENLITPATASLQPTTFMGAAPGAEPQKVGSYLYFADKGRMYLYVPQGANLAQAVEVSSHCPGYLPNSFGEFAVASGQDSMFMVDADNPNLIYQYTARFQGQTQQQSCFSRFVLGSESNVLSIWYHEDYLHALIYDGTSLRLEKAFLERQYEYPYMDHYRTGSWSYNASTNTSSITKQGILPGADVVVVKDGDQRGVEYSVEAGTLTVTESGSQQKFTVPGRILDADGYVGKKYEMRLGLSPQVIRDGNNMFVDGVLNLKDTVTKHFRSGSYSIEVSKTGRDQLLSTSSFSDYGISRIGDSTAPLGELQFDPSGEFRVNSQGDAESTNVAITSTSTQPVNITNVEIRATFNAAQSTPTF